MRSRWLSLLVALLFAAGLGTLVWLGYTTYHQVQDGATAYQYLNAIVGHDGHNQPVRRFQVIDAMMKSMAEQGAQK